MILSNQTGHKLFKSPKIRAYKQEYSCTEIQVSDNGSPVENVWVEGGMNTNNTIMGIYSRPSGQLKIQTRSFCIRCPLF